MLFLFPLLINTLPGRSACEVTT